MTCTVTNNTEDGTIDILDEATGVEYAHLKSKVKKVTGCFVSGKKSDWPTAYGTGKVTLTLEDNINGTETIEPTRQVDILICNQFTSLGVTNQETWEGTQEGVDQAVEDIKEWCELE